MRFDIPNATTAYFDRYLESELTDAFKKVLAGSFYVMGQECVSFEKAFASFCHVDFCIGVGNGLDALTLILKALGIGHGDEVIVPANTYIATVLAITRVGATPVFVEPDISTCNIDPARIEEKITAATRVIMPVHLYGRACEMNRIKEVADRYSLYIVEDCAQAHGAVYNGQPVGSFGIASGFSFYPTKNLGALGDGGAVITDDEELAEKIRALRNYGSEKKYYNQYCGVNSRLDELQAAFLNVKLKHMDEMLSARKKIAEKYMQSIKNPQIILPAITDEAEHVWHIFAIRCKKREKLKTYLAGRGIQTAVHYPVPPHLQECYKYLGYKKGDFPVAEEISETELTLPLYYGMQEEHISWLIECVNSFR